DSNGFCCFPYFLWEKCYHRMRNFNETLGTLTPSLKPLLGEEDARLPVKGGHGRSILLEEEGGELVKGGVSEKQRRRDVYGKRVVVVMGGQAGSEIGQAK